KGLGRYLRDHGRRGGTRGQDDLRPARPPVPDRRRHRQRGPADDQPEPARGGPQGDARQARPAGQGRGGARAERGRGLARGPAGAGRLGARARPRFFRRGVEGSRRPAEGVRGGSGGAGGGGVLADWFGGLTWEDALTWALGVAP